MYIAGRETVKRAWCLTFPRFLHLSPFCNLVARWVARSRVGGFGPVTPAISRHFLRVKKEQTVCWFLRISFSSSAPPPPPFFGIRMEDRFLFLWAPYIRICVRNILDTEFLPMIVTDRDSRTIVISFGEFFAAWVQNTSVTPMLLEGGLRKNIGKANVFRRQAFKNIGKTDVSTRRASRRGWCSQQSRKRGRSMWGQGGGG